MQISRQRIAQLGSLLVSFPLHHEFLDLDTGRKSAYRFNRSGNELPVNQEITSVGKNRNVGLFSGKNIFLKVFGNHDDPAGATFKEIFLGFVQTFHFAIHLNLFSAIDHTDQLAAAGRAVEVDNRGFQFADNFIFISDGISQGINDQSTEQNQKSTTVTPDIPDLVQVKLPGHLDAFEYFLEHSFWFSLFIFRDQFVVPILVNGNQIFTTKFFPSTFLLSATFSAVVKNTRPVK